MKELDIKHTVSFDDSMIKGNYSGMGIRDFEESDDKLFYHIFTGIKSLKSPVKISIQSNFIETFRDFLKEKQNKGEVRIKNLSKDFILLPRYSQKLKSDEFSLPKSILPLFPEHLKTQNLRSYY